MIWSNNDSDMGEHLVQFITPMDDGIPAVLPDKIQALKKFVEEYFEAANIKTYWGTKRIHVSIFFPSGVSGR